MTYQSDLIYLIIPNIRALINQLTLTSVKGIVVQSVLISIGGEKWDWNSELAVDNLDD